MENYKILFSDIGGVLLSNGWGHESRQAAAAQFGFDYEEMNRLHEFIFNVYEIGKISLDQYLDIAVFNQPRKFSREEFKDFMYSCSTELPDMLPWLIEWKMSHPAVKIISINNEPRELNNYRIKKFKLHRLFDAFVSSCEVGMRKPDPGIFHLAIGIGQISKENCLFIDDRKMLAEAAQKEGLNSWQHHNFIDTKNKINTFFSG